MDQFLILHDEVVFGVVCGVRDGHFLDYLLRFRFLLGTASVSRSVFLPLFYFVLPSGDAS